MMTYVNLFLVFIGIVFLVLGLVNVRKIIQSAQGSYKYYWCLICGLIIFFVIGYIIATIFSFHSNLEASWTAAVVALIFCFGALFVLLVTMLSAKTIFLIVKGAELKIEAEHDFLTSLYNRNYFQKEIESILDRVKQGGPESIFVFFDLNNFNTINEIYGRVGGDQLLIAVANIIKNNIRKADLAIRYDGDEFIMILYNTKLAVAEEQVKAIHAAIMQLARAKYPQATALGCAVGMTIINKDVRDVSHLLSTIDKACYASKISHNIVCKLCELP